MITVLQANTTTATAAVPLNGTETAIATGVEKPLSVHLRVTSLTSGKTARFEIQSSTDNFVSVTRHKVLEAHGPITEETPYGFPPVHHYDMEGFPAGTASAEVRITLASMDAAASCDWEAHMVHGS